MNKWNRKFLGLALGVFAIGCSDGGGALPPAEQTNGQSAQDSPYGIKVWVERNGKPGELVVIGPADSGAADSVSSDDERSSQSQPATVNAPGVRPMATIGQNGGSVDTAANDKQNQLADGWTLAHWALRTCTPPPVGTTIPDSPFGDLQFGIAGAPWTYKWGNALGGYYFFYWKGLNSDFTQDCDKALFMEETLLCAADRLTQLSDSPGTTTWNVPKAAYTGSSVEDPNEDDDEVTVTIPPQGSDDLFIAREMAFNILAHINGLETRPDPEPTDPEEGLALASCNTVYARAAAGQLYDWTNKENPSFTSYFDPGDSFPFDEDHLAEVHDAAVRRINRKAMMLASAARLTNRLIEQSIEQDLAGAQQFLTAGGTSVKGAQRAWGMAEGQSPANTFRHAIKTLFGRLEIGNNRSRRVSRALKPVFNNGSQFVWDPRTMMRDDPRCYGEYTTSAGGHGDGYVANDSIIAASGGLSARWSSAPPSSPDEAQAASALLGAGIVFPPSLALSDATLLGEDSVIIDELVRQAAMRAKPASATTPSAIEQFITDYAASEFGTAYRQALSKLPAAAWRYGILRSYGAFRLATHADEIEADDATDSLSQLQDVAELAGLTLSDAANSVETTGGVVVEGGLVRNEVLFDPMTIMGNVQRNSNCGVNELTGFPPNGVMDPGGTAVLGFQNPFFLGQAFKRHLKETTVLNAAAGNADQSQVAEFAQAAAAEVETWAGPGFMVRDVVKNSSNTPVTAVEFVDLTYKDLDVENMTELVDRLVLVAHDRYGAASSQVLADCNAGIRTSCPAALDEPGDVVHADVGQAISWPVHWYAPMLQVEFEEISHWGRYVVLRPKNGKPGRVLGFLPPATLVSGSTYRTYAEVISPRQRELLNRVLGLPADGGISRTCGEQTPLALPMDYCIPGMKRDEFVSLANSITAGGSGAEDSFKHYLDVAEQSAKRADDLGRELIDLGLQRDIRAEGASEEVSQICGTYPKDASSASFSSGEVKPSSEDAALSACLAPETVDLVFLREDLAKGSKKTQDELCELFCGENGTQAPFCSRKCENGARKANTPDITSAGLEMASDPQPRVPSLSACKAFPDAFQDGNIDLGKIDDAMNQGGVSASSLGVAVSAFTLEERENGQWVLLKGGRPIVGTRTLTDQTLAALGSGTLNEVWPHCQGATGGCTAHATLMGRVFGDGTGENSNLPGMRRRVERALYFMGALAGYTPPGVFKLPMPVIDRSVVSGEIAAPAYYSPGRFEEVGSTGRFRPKASAYGGAGNAYPLSADAAMPPLHRPAVSVSAFLSDRQGTMAKWRREFFQFASQKFAASTNAVFMSDPIGNAAIKFDKLLDPLDSSSTRSNLRPWLQRIFSDFERGSLKPSQVQQATFFRSVNDKGEVAKFCAAPGQDGEFFEGGGQELVHGRQVCANAPVSPIFYSTSAAFDHERSPETDSCYDTVLDGHLFSTHRARAVDKGHAKIPQSQINPIAHPGWEIGWFRLLPAVGIDRSDGCQVEGSDYCLNADEDGFSWSQIVSSNCAQQKLWTVGNPGECEHEGGFYNNIKFEYGDSIMIAQDRLRPDLCTPSDRVELFLENDVVDEEADIDDATHAIEVLLSTLTLACASEVGSASIDQAPPPINNVQDMLYLEAWAAEFSAATWRSADLLYLVDIPMDVVATFRGGGANVGAVAKGSQGQILLELEKNLRLLESSISGLGTEMANLSMAIAEARSSIRGIELEAKGEELKLRLARVEYARQVALMHAAKARKMFEYAFKAALTVAAAAGTCFITAGAGCAAAVLFAATALAKQGGNILDTEVIMPTIRSFAGIDDPDDINTAAAEQAIEILDEQSETNVELKNNRIEQALIALSGAVRNSQERVDEKLTSLRNSTSSALQNLGQLTQGRNAAAIALAKASGADFVDVGSSGGGLVPLHVNTVYRRQFDITQQRYTTALLSAKRAAYLARLAIEERLGVKLGEIREAIGPLEAPAVWVDNVCTVQGVDYTAIRQAIEPTNGDNSQQELDLIRGFANQYVGDYVSQLREFVEFYNLQYPFADATDTALISLRKDVQDPSMRCVVPSDNLLFYSDQLQSFAPAVARGPSPSYGGWNITGCSESYCTEVATGAQLLATTASNSPLLEAPTPGAVSWLYTRARSTQVITSVDETGTTTVPAEPPVVGKPAGLVFQTVDLEAGQDYILSWWDQARAANGAAISTTTTQKGRVAVYDADWNPVAQDSFNASKSWSDRRTLAVIPASSGAHHIGFAPALADATGSVVIANVQLEKLSRGVASASSYGQTTSSRTQIASDCVSDASQFLSRFDYQCDSSGCWHILRQPLVIDTEALNKGGSTLIGSLAQGNYNYRLSSIAVNLVGSGLRDCSGQDVACYGNGYLEYDLEHVAYNVPMEDYRNKVSCFNFGAAAIRSGKGIAAERTLSLPLGGSERDFVSQSPFLKTELSGRPLSGAYRFRIKDSPGLVWRALQDVQLLINYSYWSRVNAQPSR